MYMECGVASDSESSLQAGGSSRPSAKGWRNLSCWMTAHPVLTGTTLALIGIAIGLIGFRSPSVALFGAAFIPLFYFSALTGHRRRHGS